MQSAGCLLRAALKYSLTRLTLAACVFCGHVRQPRRRGRHFCGDDVFLPGQAPALHTQHNLTSSSADSFQYGRHLVVWRFVFTSVSNNYMGVSSVQTGPLEKIESCWLHIGGCKSAIPHCQYFLSGGKLMEANSLWVQGSQIAGMQLHMYTRVQIMCPSEAAGRRKCANPVAASVDLFDIFWAVLLFCSIGYAFKCCQQCCDGWQNNS